MLSSVKSSTGSFLSKVVDGDYPFDCSFNDESLMHVDADGCITRAQALAHHAHVTYADVRRSEESGGMGKEWLLFPYSFIELG